MIDLLSSISLRLTHPNSLSAAAIISEFDLKIRISHTVNEHRRTPKGTPLEGVYKETYCCFELKEKGLGRLDRDLASGCGYLEKHPTFLQEFLRTGGTVDFYIGIFLEGDGGFEIDNICSREFRRLVSVSPWRCIHKVSGMLPNDQNRPPKRQYLLVYTPGVR